MTTALASTCAGCGRTGPMRSCRDNVSGREVPVCDATPIECAARIPLAPSLAPQARRGSGMEAAGERWAATVSEAVFQERVIAIARRHGWMVYHTHDSRRSAAGFPDLVMARGGRLVFAELKTAKGKLSSEQIAWLEALGCEPEPDADRVTTYLWRPSDLPEIKALLSDGEEVT